MPKYIILSEEELNQIVKKVYLSGQNRGISLLSRLEFPDAIEDYVEGEVEYIFETYNTSSKKDSVDGWGGC
jgi:hypothetical protein